MLSANEERDLRMKVARMMRVPSFNYKMKALMGDCFEWYDADSSSTKIEDLKCALELIFPNNYKQ